MVVAGAVGIVALVVVVMVMRVFIVIVMVVMLLVVVMVMIVMVFVLLMRMLVVMVVMRMLVLRLIGGVLGEDAVHQCEPMAGSEDFSYVSQAVPSAFVQLGAGAPGWAPVHNSKMVLDESALACGVAAHVAVALGWLRRHAGDPDPKE